MIGSALVIVSTAYALLGPAVDTPLIYTSILPPSPCQVN